MGAGCSSNESTQTKSLPSDKKPPVEKVTEKVSRNVSKRNSTVKFAKIDLFSNTNSKIMDKYEFLSVLGTGKLGTKLKLYRNKKLNSMKYAIKTLFKKDYMLKEINNLKNLDHPNIVKYFETYEERNQLHLVMEYVLGENLTTHINKRNQNKFSGFRSLCIICL